MRVVATGFNFAITLWTGPIYLLSLSDILLQLLPALHIKKPVLFFVSTLPAPQVLYDVLELSVVFSLRLVNLAELLFGHRWFSIFGFRSWTKAFHWSVSLLCSGIRFQILSCGLVIGLRPLRLRRLSWVACWIYPCLLSLARRLVLIDHRLIFLISSTAAALALRHWNFGNWVGLPKSLWIGQNFSFKLFRISFAFLKTIPRTGNSQRPPARLAINFKLFVKIRELDAVADLVHIDTLKGAIIFWDVGLSGYRWHVIVRQVSHFAIALFEGVIIILVRLLFWWLFLPMSTLLALLLPFLLSLRSFARLLDRFRLGQSRARLFLLRLFSGFFRFLTGSGLTLFDSNLANTTLTSDSLTRTSGCS